MLLLMFLLNFISSYLIASVFGNLLILFVAFFAFVVLNMEFASLFGQMTSSNIVVLTLLNLLFSVVLFKYKKSKLIGLNFDFKRLKNSLLLDKTLFVLAIGFIILLGVSFFLASVMPVLEPDSQTYHFLRAYEFTKQHSLSHFETNDIRALIMPINSEILYSWMLLFKKNFYGYGIVSFSAFILTICSIWQIFEKFKFSFRKRLYSIFLLSSFSAVVIQMTSLQTDIVVGALLICAFSLFIDKKIYFSSLSLALALGVKSTGIIALLGFFILIILYEKLIQKNKSYKNITNFIVCLMVNFVIFSSYNYVLNIIQFHNPLSNHAAYLGHCFWGGIKGYIANLIHFIFQSLDFTGFKWGYYLNDNLMQIKTAIFEFININPYIGCNVEQEKINITTDEQVVGFGILGFLVFLPCLLFSLFYKIKNNNKRTTLLFILAITFIVNVLVLARATAYMVFSIRFIVAFVCLSSLILAYAYRKRCVFKPIIVFFSLFYMVLVSTHNQRMPFFPILNGLKNNDYNITQFSEECYKGKIIPALDLAYNIYETIKEKYPTRKNIAVVKTLESSLLYLKKLDLEGYNIVFLNPYTLSKDDYSKFDLIILEGNSQNDNVFNPEDVKINYKKQENSDNIIFNSNDELNSFYIYISKRNNVDVKDALERTSFTKGYIERNNNFKLDFIQEHKLTQIEKNIKIYYYLNQIKG